MKHATRTQIPVLAAAIVVLCTACASSMLKPQDLGMTRQTTAGQVLVDSSGKTLYTFDRDAPGQSNCTGACAVAWPPVQAPQEAMPRNGFTIIIRESGTRQWTYKGMPLYDYIQDRRPGDVAGNGDEGVWHVATP
jgi:predicted lipoprotein with Yx(FWY)xxD motif